MMDIILENIAKTIHILSFGSFEAFEMDNFGVGLMIFHSYFFFSQIALIAYGTNSTKNL